MAPVVAKLRYSAATNQKKSRTIICVLLNIQWKTVQYLDDLDQKMTGKFLILAL